MKRTAMQHTKMRRLVRALGVPQWGAVGILESLWHLTARETPFGDIGKLSDEDIADWIGWDDDAGKLIEALVVSGWLDRDERTRLSVHDWEDHADDTTKKALHRHRERLSGNVQTEPDKEPLPVPLPEPEPKPEVHPPTPLAGGGADPAMAAGDAAELCPEPAGDAQDRADWEGVNAMRSRLKPRPFPPIPWETWAEEKRRERECAQPPATLVGLRLTAALPEGLRESEFGGDAGAAAAWVLERRGITDAGMGPVLGKALAAGLRECGGTLELAAVRAVASHTRLAELTPMLRYAWGPRKFFAQGHWLRPDTWPLDRQALDQARRL